MFSIRNQPPEYIAGIPWCRSQNAVNWDGSDRNYTQCCVLPASELEDSIGTGGWVSSTSWRPRENQERLTVLVLAHLGCPGETDCLLLPPQTRRRLCDRSVCHSVNRITDERGNGRRPNLADTGSD